MGRGKVRRVDTYSGGEKMAEGWVSGAGADRHLEVTGVDFYKTIEQLPAVRRYYLLARARTFDIYHLFRGGGNYFVGNLRKAHSGLLPAYLRWFVVGLLIVVWVVTEAGS